MRELVAMTLCIRDEAIEYVMGYMFEDIITMNNNYERKMISWGMCKDLEVSSDSGRSIRDKMFNGRPEISDESFMCEMSH